MRDALNLVPGGYDNEGVPHWHSQMSVTSNTTRALVLAAPNKVIPVILIPGIMGSNIKVKGADSIVWRPDGAGLADIVRDAADRQKLMDPQTTEVDTRAKIGSTTYVTSSGPLNIKAAEHRGWGSVMWKSYSEVLIYMETHLSSPCFWDDKLKKVLISSAWADLVDNGFITTNTGSHKLTQAELERLSEYWLPAHAIGYNWLQSNEQSGTNIAKKIDEIIAFYQKRFKNPNACEKVILVTHSMGGLAARAAVVAATGGTSEKVLGIVHGVMPAIGAGLTYVQMRTGAKSDGSGLFGIMGQAARHVIGATGRELTPVLGQSPGALQLLPNKAYAPSGWLKIEGVTASAYAVPLNGNPYDSIYRERYKWWRLVHEAWLDPAGKYKKNAIANAWDAFLVTVAKAEVFHDRLGNHYHPATYVFYGADKNHKAYGNVTWKKVGWMDENIADLFNSQAISEDIMKNGSAHEYWDNSVGGTAGRIGSNHSSFSLTGPNEDGDGTVPKSSGGAPGGSNIKFEAAMTGIDHQGSYSSRNTAVMNYLLYSTCKIVQLT